MILRSGRITSRRNKSHSILFIKSSVLLIPKLCETSWINMKLGVGTFLVINGMTLLRPLHPPLTEPRYITTWILQSEVCITGPCKCTSVGSVNNSWSYHSNTLHLCTRVCWGKKEVNSLVHICFQLTISGSTKMWVNMVVIITRKYNIDLGKIPGQYRTLLVTQCVSDLLRYIPVQ
jgi:hypothetical protein